MLYSAPALDEQDRAVIDGIEQHRTQLRFHLREPRRWTGQLRRNLRARAMRGSNSIEGYDVTLDDAIALLEGEETIDADQRTVLEVRGYRNAMTYVQQLAADSDFAYDESLLRSLHFMMLGHDLSKSPGSYRRGEIFVRDEDLDEIVYVGPDAELVPDLMKELVVGLEAADHIDSDCPSIVTAAMAHLNLVMIHPFRDGNGRMARCLQTMVLARHQVLSPEFSSIEEWLGRNTSAYYDILAQTGRGRWNPAGDARAWVRFNLRAHHIQAQTVLQRVNESIALWDALAQLAARNRLHERTITGLYGAASGLRLRRRSYEIDAEVEPETAGRDLRAMVSAGLLIPHGETRGRYYLGSKELRGVYSELRSQRPKTLTDPYELPAGDLGPVTRRRVTTVTADSESR